jgi:hypothetical protein
MNKPIGLYRRVMRYKLDQLRKENKEIKTCLKELEVLSYGLAERERQLGEMERLLVARSQHYDPNNPRVRHKIIRLRKQLLKHIDG